MSDNLKNQNDFVYACLARTTSEKLAMSSGNTFTSAITPYYAVKLESERLIFQKLIKGTFKAVKGFSDVTFEIKLDEIKSCRKKHYIIGPLRNFGMPRFEMTLKNGETLDISIWKAKSCKEAREKLINTLQAIS